MRLFFFHPFLTRAPWLAAATLGALTIGCDAPTRQPAAAAATPTAAPLTRPAASVDAYALDTVRLDQEVSAQRLMVHTAYPRLRPLAGTLPTDTVGIGAFNKAAKKLVVSLVKEIEATARENRPQQLSSGLNVTFKSYALRQGLASVAFTVTQDGIGPRPLTWATGLTYDLRTGRQLTPADLFQQTPAFRQAVLAALQPLLDGSDDCEYEPSNMSWDNFSLGPTAYYLLLGDPQVGRACPTREVAVPLKQLQAFANPRSPAVRFR